MKFVFVFTLFLMLGSMLAGVNGQRGCFCTAQFDPVCGVDGRTYGNTCKLNCAGVRLKHRGSC